MIPAEAPQQPGEWKPLRRQLFYHTENSAPSVLAQNSQCAVRPSLSLSLFSLLTQTSIV
jgi:hypothetical protein